MQLNDVVTMFGADLQHRYGEKIHKISLHGGFNCAQVVTDHWVVVVVIGVLIIGWR